MTGNNWAALCGWREENKEEQTCTESCGITNTSPLLPIPASPGITAGLCVKRKMGVRALIMHFYIGRLKLYYVVDSSAGNLRKPLALFHHHDHKAANKHIQEQFISSLWCILPFNRVGYTTHKATINWLGRVFVQQGLYTDIKFIYCST